MLLVRLLTKKVLYVISHTIVSVKKKEIEYSIQFKPLLSLVHQEDPKKSRLYEKLGLKPHHHW